jgi:mRNA interferase RelE/StbE
MTYQLIYSRRAVRDIKKLNPKDRLRIKTNLEKYLNDPLRYAEKLTHPALGTYRFRIGDYRVICDIEEEEIVVLRVGHRKEIYRGKL